MSTVTIVPGQLVVQDPADVRVYQFDWSTDNLATGVQIAGTPVYTVTAVKPSTTDTALVVDQKSVLSGNRKTQCRLSAGTLGQTYDVACKIVTDESPAQTKERSFRVLIQNL